jgi:hypothetical protein
MQKNAEQGRLGRGTLAELKSKVACAKIGGIRGSGQAFAR